MPFWHLANICLLGIPRGIMGMDGCLSGSFSFWKPKGSQGSPSINSPGTSASVTVCTGQSFLAACTDSVLIARTISCKRLELEFLSRMSEMLCTTDSLEASFHCCLNLRHQCFNFSSCHLVVSTASSSSFVAFFVVYLSLSFPSFLRKR